MNKRTTKALILAAGQGSRLRPFTQSAPKAMVPFADVPLLDYQLAVLRHCGIEQIAVVTGYCAETLAAYPLPRFYNAEHLSTNMVYSLFCAEDFMAGNEDLLICYSDILYQPQLIEQLLATEADAAVVADLNWYKLWRCRMDDPLSDAESFKVKEGYLLELGKKASSLDDISAQYTGLIKISARRLADFIQCYRSLPEDGLYDGKTKHQMFMTSLLQLMIEQGWRIKPAYCEGGWLEIDTVSDLNHYQQMEAEGRLFSELALDIPMLKNLVLQGKASLYQD